MALNPDSLEVTSFQVSGTEPRTGMLENTKYPICIVYVSDCVSCFPEGVAGVE